MTVGTPSTRTPSHDPSVSRPRAPAKAVTARAHPVPELVQEIPLTALELRDAHAIHARRSVIGPDLLPRLIHEAFRDLKRPPRWVCSAHQLLPDTRVGIRVSWLARPLRSSPITGPSTLIRAGPPLRLAVLCPRRFLPPRFSLSRPKGHQPRSLAAGIETTGSPLPCQRPRRAHATLTPSTTKATRRPSSGYTTPTGVMLSRRYAPTPVAMLSIVLRCVSSGSTMFVFSPHT